MDLKDRVERIESKIDSIGAMLRALLNSQTHHPSPPQVPLQDTPNLGDALASIASKPLQHFVGKIDRWLGPDAENAHDHEIQDQDQDQASAWGGGGRRPGSGVGQAGVGTQSYGEGDNFLGSYNQGSMIQYQDHADSDEDQEPDSGYGRDRDSDGGHHNDEGEDGEDGDSDGGSSNGAFGLRRIRQLGLGWRR